MLPNDLIRISFNNLYNRKLRTFLSILGVIIGVAAVVGLMSIGMGFERGIQEQLSVLGGNLVIIAPGSPDSNTMFGGGGFGHDTQATLGQLTMNDVDALKSVRGMEFVDGILSYSSAITFRGETASVSVMGVTPEMLDFLEEFATLGEGRTLTASDAFSVIIGSTIAHDLFSRDIRLGDVLDIEGTDFRVVGILKSGSGVSAAQADNGIVMSREVLRRHFFDESNRELSIIFSRLLPQTDMERAVEDIEDKLRTSHRVAPGREDFTVISSQQIQSQVGQITSSITIFLFGIAAISLLVGGIGIANTMFTSVMERTRQIGILKALGSTNRDILNIFLAESGLMGLVGGIAGTLLGSLIAFLFSLAGSGGGIMSGPFSSFTPVISPELVAFAIGFSLAIGIIAGLLPARRASRLEPVEALRYE